jgi:hypothetical protein
MGIAEWVIVAVAAIGVVAALIGWDRYRGNRTAASESSQPTDEVFTDPAWGKAMRVWYNPATGERGVPPRPTSAVATDGDQRGACVRA